MRGHGSARSTPDGFASSSRPRLQWSLVGLRARNERDDANRPTGAALDLHRQGEHQGSGGRDYWRLEALPLDVRLLHAFAHRFVWDGGPVHVDGTVREGDPLAGFEVVDLSGHAPGLIGLWRERDRVALVSDCFYMNDMHGRPQPPSVPLDAYNFDTAQARRSIRKLAELRPAVACPGHLGPLGGTDVVAQLEAASGDLSGRASRV